MLRLAAILIALSAGTAAAANPPQRIVSAAPSITEMLYAIGVGDRVAGVTEFCHYPPEARRKPKIGSYLHPSLETILEMRPDLVVVLTEHGELAHRLKRVGLPVLDLQHNTLAGIYESLQQLGARTGAAEAAQWRIEEIQEALQDIREKAARLPRRTVMFVVGRTPGTIHDLMVVGRRSFLNELIAIAGGRNVFEDAPNFYPRIPREELYARRPDVIIDMGDMGDTDKATAESRLAVAELWQALPTLPAVKQGRVYAVAEDIFVVPGPRVIEAARSLFAMIHPEDAE